MWFSYVWSDVKTCLFMSDHTNQSFHSHYLDPTVKTIGYIVDVLNGTHWDPRKVVRYFAYILWIVISLKDINRLTTFINPNNSDLKTREHSCQPEKFVAEYVYQDSSSSMQSNVPEFCFWMKLTLFCLVADWSWAL